MRGRCASRYGPHLLDEDGRSVGHANAFLVIEGPAEDGAPKGQRCCSRRSVKFDSEEQGDCILGGFVEAVEWKGGRQGF